MAGFHRFDWLGLGRFLHFLQQLHEHVLRPAAEVGAQPVGEQQRRSRWNDTHERSMGLSAGEADWREIPYGLRLGF